MTFGATPEDRGHLSPVARVDEGVRRLSHAMVLAAGWGMLIMGLMVAADVLWRAVSGRNFGGVDEIASYLFAIAISWSLASTFHARAHIRVDALYRKLPFVPRIALDITAMLSLLMVALFLCYSSWLVLDTSWGRGARSASALQVPLVVPQALWLLGAALFAVAVVSALVRALDDMLRKRGVAVVARHGVPTPDEEAQYAVVQSRGES